MLISGASKQISSAILYYFSIFYNLLKKSELCWIIYLFFAEFHSTIAEFYCSECNDFRIIAVRQIRLEFIWDLPHNFMTAVIGRNSNVWSPSPPLYCIVYTVASLHPIYLYSLLNCQSFRSLWKHLILKTEILNLNHLKRICELYSLFSLLLSSILPRCSGKDLMILDHETWLLSHGCWISSWIGVIEIGSHLSDLH